MEKRAIYVRSIDAESVDPVPGVKNKFLRSVRSRISTPDGTRSAALPRPPRFRFRAFGLTGVDHGARRRERPK